jgi:hypothetical protein
MLLPAFAALMLLAALAMLRRSTRADLVMDAAPPAYSGASDTLAAGSGGKTASAVLAPKVSRPARPLSRELLPQRSLPLDSSLAS